MRQLPEYDVMVTDGARTLVILRENFERDYDQHGWRNTGVVSVDEHQHLAPGELVLRYESRMTP